MSVMTKEEAQKLAAEIIGPEVLDRIKAAEEKAAKLEERLKAFESGNVFSLVKTAGEIKRSLMSSPDDKDPLDGKGVDFVKFIKAQAIGKRTAEPPAEVAKKMGYGETVVKALSESKPEDGGYLVPNQISTDFIALLRGREVFTQLGATTLDFKGSMEILKQTASGSAAYIGEMMAIPVSQPKIGSVKLMAKKLGALYAASNDLLRNESAGAMAMMREDMLKVISLYVDLVRIRGPGTEYTPRGIRYWTHTDHLTTQTTTVNAQNVVTDLARMAFKVERAEVDTTRAGWIITSRVKWFLATLMDASGRFIFRDEIAAGTILGYPFRVTNQIPENLGAFGNQTEIYFGAFGEAVIGTDTRLIVEAFPNGTWQDAGGKLISGISQDATPIRALERHDLIVRHDRAFSVMTDCTWAPGGVN